MKSKIEIINTSKFIKLADFVFSAVVSEEDFNEKFKSNSLIIQKTDLSFQNISVDSKFNQKYLNRVILKNTKYNSFIYKILKVFKKN